jgi:hypothetical protein
MSIYRPEAEAENAAWRDAYYIAWIGACNPRAVGATYVKHSNTLGRQHPAVRAIGDHHDFLKGESLGPSLADLESVKMNAQRLGLMPAPA